MLATRLSRAVVNSQMKRYVSTAAHKIVIVGAGTAGLTVATQLQRAFAAERRPLAADDIALVDPAKLHHYQPGWTLVGSGIAALSDQSKPLASVIPAGTKHYPVGVSSFAPGSNEITTTDGGKISYDYLVVATGLQSNFSQIPGLEEGLKEVDGPVSSIYNLASVEKTWKNIKGLKNGRAIFTQPAGIIKCAGAPQKIMWMALSQWNKDGTRSAITPAFATGTPTMFGVAKYSDALEKLRVERDVEGLFSHNLVSIDNARKEATFAKADGTKTVEKFDFLHVVPPQGPLEVIKKSPLADAAGWVSVDPATLQHTKFNNVFSLGDTSSAPNSKTAAAITAQAPVLVDNLRATMDEKALEGKYDGYASCPLLTGHNELMLAEFKYGGVPQESFGWITSQDKPNAFFYWLKKDFFPWVYWASFIKGTWFGTKGPFRPISYMKE